MRTATVPTVIWARRVVLVTLVVPLATTALLVPSMIRSDPMQVVAAGPPLAVVAPAVMPATPAARTTDPYAGYGAWIDVFDFSPPYAGEAPAVTPDVVDEMAAAGVRTIYLQAARLDERSPLGLEDPVLLARFLDRAHAAGIDVVAWYLPRFEDPVADLDRLALMADFDVLGHRFDGVAVDIEWIGELDHPERSLRLVEMSEQLRARSGTDALGAIVLPPALTEVVNPDYWPGFPWSEISGLYDVWMPMAYWSFRSGEYGDGATYLLDSVARLRDNLGQPGAVVHAVGGIGGVDGVDDPPDPEEPLTSLDELTRFVSAVNEAGAVGASIYDWRTLEPAARELLTSALAAPSPSG